MAEDSAVPELDAHLSESRLIEVWIKHLRDWGIWDETCDIKILGKSEIEFSKYIVDDFAAKATVDEVFGWDTPTKEVKNYILGGIVLLLIHYN